MVPHDKSAPRFNGGEDKPETAAEVFIERQVLAEEPHRLDRIVVELARAGDRHPVAPQQIAHRRTRPHAGEQVVSCGQ